MKKNLITVTLILGLVALCGLTAWAASHEIKQGDFVTVCKAGKDCGKFDTAVMDAKTCKCGAEADKLHVLKVEGEFAVLCQCGGGCACELNAKNPYLCGCGSPVKVVRIIK